MLWVPLNMGMSAAHCRGIVREMSGNFRVSGEWSPWVLSAAFLTHILYCRSSGLTVTNTCQPFFCTRQQLMVYVVVVSIRLSFRCTNDWIIQFGTTSRRCFFPTVACKSCTSCTLTEAASNTIVLTVVQAYVDLLYTNCCHLQLVFACCRCVSNVVGDYIC